MVAESFALVSRLRKAVGEGFRAAHKHLPAPSHTVQGSHFTVRLTQDTLDGGWIAEVVQMPGCMSQGETREEAMENVIEAFREILTNRLSQKLERRPARPKKKTQTFDLAVGPR